MYICMCECICICICHDDAYILRDGEQSQKDLHKCQKRPTQVSKETYTSVKRDLHKCQKRPSQVSKENNRGIMHACHVCCKEMKNNIGQTKYAHKKTLSSSFFKNEKEKFQCFFQQIKNDKAQTKYAHKNTTVNALSCSISLSLPLLVSLALSPRQHPAARW